MQFIALTDKRRGRVRLNINSIHCWYESSVFVPSPLGGISEGQTVPGEPGTVVEYANTSFTVTEQPRDIDRLVNKANGQ